MRRWLFLAGFLVWMAAVTALSAMPARLLPRWGFPGSDKVVHGLVFAWGGALGAGATGGVAAGTALAGAFGLVDEAHQAFRPGRHSDRADWYADVAGAVVGALAAAAMGWTRRRAAEAAGCDGR